MLSKAKKDQTKVRCPQGTFKFLARMTRKAPYERMDKEGKKKGNKSEDKKAEECPKYKENNKNVGSKDPKEKKKKKGWKRVRQAALTTCRYIGMGAAHLSPGTVYASPDYYVDPKYWNRSFSPSYKPKVPQQTAHWTSNMMFSGW